MADTKPATKDAKAPAKQDAPVLDEDDEFAEDEEMSLAEVYTLDASDCDTDADEKECEAYLQMRKHYRSTRKGRKNKDPHF